MKNKFIFLPTIFSIIFIFIIVGVYRFNFGGIISQSHDEWGQFGDFFGGLINPIFAMLAFLALLYSISIQVKELRKTSNALGKQAVSSSEQIELSRQQIVLSREQLVLSRDSRAKDDLLHVMQDIDIKIDEELKVLVTASDADTVLNIGHMVREAKQSRQSLENNIDTYQRFVKISGERGSLMESSITEITHLLSRMRTFLSYYSQYEDNRFSPAIIYYADKCYQLIDMLEDIGTVGEDERKFFATISDRHG